MAETHDIIELVRGATVWVADGPPPGGTLHGTGFFVAPGFAVTCAHVLAGAGATPYLWWSGGSGAVLDHRMAPQHPQADGNWREWPDAAVVRVDRTDHPVVPLGGAVVDHDVWCYGITRARTGAGGRPEPDGRRLKITLADSDGFLQLTQGRILPGMSGGPVLDLAQFAVVGLTQSTADDRTDAGGWATPIEAALELWTDADLRQANADVDRVSINALRRDQKLLGALPGLIQNRWLETVAGPLRTYLENELGLQPPPLPDGAEREWVARQLFRLNLPQLVKALKNALGDHFKDNAKLVFSFVAPCLPSGVDADSHWVFPDMAVDVRSELDEARPRIVHLGTDRELSATVLLQRAFEERITLRRCGSASGATSTAGGVPSQQYDDIVANIYDQLAAEPSDWAEYPKQTADNFRQMGTIVEVDPGAAPDAKWLLDLAAAFPGLRMVIRRRDITVPAGAEAVVHSAAPPFDQRNERGALRAVLELNTALKDLNIEPFPT